MALVLNTPSAKQTITQDGQLQNGNGNGNFNANGGQQGQESFEGFSFDSEEDSELKDIFGAFGDDADSEIEVDDNWLNPLKKEGEADDEEEDDGSEETEAAKTLMTELQNSLKNVKIDPRAIPADFDASNPQHLEKLLNHTAQQATSSAIALMMKPMKHYVESVQKSLQGEIQKSVKRGGLQGDIQKAFAPFNSLKDKSHLKLAQSLFRETYSTTRDLGKATKTTAAMLKRIGINVDMRQGSGGTQNAATSQRFEGVDALDDFFGVTPKRK